ncbi:MAG: 3-coathanger stack domain-containing protein, partial [bacterium]
MKKKRLTYIDGLLFIIIIMLCYQLPVAYAGQLLLSTPLDDGPYVSDGTISAQDNCVINSNQYVFFGAQDKIVLKPGFEARAGCTFTAKIGNYLSLDADTDNDGDGMADWWELAAFHTNSYGAYDDYDGDGYPNIIEYTENTQASNPYDMPNI